VESGETAKLDYILPFSQIIDCEGADENTKNIISCEVMSYDLRLKSDMLSDKPAIALDVRLCVTAEGYSERELEIAADAFSLDYLSSPSFENISAAAHANPVSESGMEKLSIGLEGGKISKILDIFSDSVTLNVKPDDSGLKAEGRINLCMLALNENRTPVFIERSSDFSRDLASAEGSNSLIFPCAKVSGISYRLSDDSTAEIRCELRITGGAIEREQINAVSGVEIFEDRPIVSDNCALALYFAEKGENLWEIAKAHNTRLSRLLSENSQEEIVLDSPKMLLIPKA
jgi:hypothetical protein